MPESILPHKRNLHRPRYTLRQKRTINENPSTQIDRVIQAMWQGHNNACKGSLYFHLRLDHSDFAQWVMAQRRFYELHKDWLDSGCRKNMRVRRRKIDLDGDQRIGNSYLTTDREYKDRMATPWVLPKPLQLNALPPSDPELFSGYEKPGKQVVRVKKPQGGAEAVHVSRSPAQIAAALRRKTTIRNDALRLLDSEEET
jgi:hypothetical protein